VGDFLESVQALYLVDGLDEGGESAVDCEDVRVGDGADGKKIEKICVQLPNSGAAKLILALHVEAIVLGDGPELMVAPDQQDLLGVFEF
jgi:hypothetical protein